jgi:hypothetical protein
VINLKTAQALGYAPAVVPLPGRRGDPMSPLEFITQHGKIDTKAIASLDVDAMVNAMQAF